MTQQGIQNIKDIIVVGKVITVKMLIESKKDGFQVSDILTTVTSPEFKAALADAIKDINLVPSEIKDIDTTEAIELAQFLLVNALEVLAALGLQNSTIKDIENVLNILNTLGTGVIVKVIEFIKFLGSLIPKTSPVEIK